jgi:LuxR family maltose regulon positive regulatory protein
LVSEWLYSRTTPAASWLSLDPEENDPSRFFTYLLAALARVDPSMTAEADMLLATHQLPPADLLMNALINGIAACDRPGFILVLDDYHVVTEAAVHEVLETLLDRGAPQMHLVIITRQDPPLPLSRLRARDQLTELRQRDLRFSTEEVLRFFNESMQLEVSEENAAALNERTEGWVAGLQMAALSMRGRDPAEIDALVERFSGRHHHILDYLADEVLDRQPAAIQDFLLRCSVLERLSAPLCDALLETSKASQTTLRELEEANLFLIPLDEERRWFRFHHLFADLLQARLRAIYPELASKLHHRAAVWLEANDLPVEAVNQALASGYYPLAADIIGRAAARIAALASLDVGMLRRWLEALPADLLLERPWLRLYLSRALYLSGEQESGIRTLAKLEADLEYYAGRSDLDQLRATIAGDRASFAAVRGEVRQAIRFSEQALSHMEDEKPIARFRPLSILAMAHYRAGELGPAETAFSEAIALVEGLNMIPAMIPLICNLAEIQLMRGQLDPALKTCQRVLDMSIVKGKRIATAGFALMEMGKIHYQRNQLADAEDMLRQGAELLSEGGIAEQFGNINTILALVLQARGDAEEAEKAIYQALEATRGSEIPRLTVLARAYQARLWLAQAQADPGRAEERLALAAAWADDYRLVGETEYLREFEDLTLVRLFLAKGEDVEACVLLNRHLPPAEEAGRIASVIEMLALRALAVAATGDLHTALADLGRSLALGWPQRFRRVYLDEGRPMAQLLCQAASHGIEHEAVGALLAAFDLPDTAPRHQPLVEPLTGRELEVLELLATGLSNPEIARQLVVSLPTVKSHTRNIYGKLGVHGRMEAVDRALALGILNKSKTRRSYQ